VYDESSDMKFKVRSTNQLNELKSKLWELKSQNNTALRTIGR
jgi:hypothetical protein